MRAANVPELAGTAARPGDGINPVRRRSRREIVRRNGWTPGAVSQKQN